MSTWQQHLESRYSAFKAIVNSSLKAFDTNDMNLAERLHLPPIGIDNSKNVITSTSRKRLTVNGFAIIAQKICQWTALVESLVKGLGMDETLVKGLICSVGLMVHSATFKQLKMSKKVDLVPKAHRSNYILFVCCFYTVKGCYIGKEPIKHLEATRALCVSLCNQKHPLFHFAYIQNDTLIIAWNLALTFKITTEILEVLDNGTCREKTHMVSDGLPKKVIIGYGGAHVHAVIVKFKTHKEDILHMGYTTNDAQVFCGQPTLTTFPNALVTAVLNEKRNKMESFECKVDSNNNNCNVNSMDNNNNNASVNDLNALTLNSNREVLEDEVIPETDEEEMGD